jgi:hypothetical protein
MKNSRAACAEGYSCNARRSAEERSKKQPQRSGTPAESHQIKVEVIFKLQNYSKSTQIKHSGG